MVSRVPLIEPLLGEKIIESSAWERWLTNVSNLLSPPNWDSAIFTPVFTALTIVGTVNVSGHIVRQGEILFFDVTVDPDPGATSASTLGTTFFELPSLFVKLGAETTITASDYGTLNGFNVETPTDFGAGYVNINTLDAFTPTWGATGDKISITGRVRIEGL